MFSDFLVLQLLSRFNQWIMCLLAYLFPALSLGYLYESGLVCNSLLGK